MMMAEYGSATDRDGPGFWAGSVAYIVLLVITVAGVAYTNVSPADSLYYWQAAVPVFALICIAIGLRAKPLLTRQKSQLVINQVLHWAAVLGVIRLLYVHQVQVLLDSNITAIIMMYLLALGTFLAGLSLNWRLCVAGAFIAVGGLAVAFVDEAAVLMMILAIALVLVFALWHRFGPE